MKALISKLQGIEYSLIEEHGDLYRDAPVYLKGKELIALLNRIEKLELTLDAAKYFLFDKELLLHEYYRIKGNCDDEEMNMFEQKEKILIDALEELEK